MAKIEAETMTETTTDITEIATETTTDLGDAATFARKRIADHRNIQIRNGQEQRKPTKASSMTAQMDASTIALKNGSSNTSLNARKEVTKIQRQRQMTPSKA